MSNSSSDSDTSDRIKNVKYLHVRHTQNSSGSGRNHSYKRKLGELVFNANFEAGNLSSAEQVDEYEFDLTIRPDVANPRYRLWFNFTVSNQSPGQCVIFTFVNLSELVELFSYGLTPVVRCKSSPNWRRLRSDQVFYYKSRGHGGRRVLSIAFRFITHDDDHQFALFFPYTPTTLCGFLKRLVVETKRSEYYINQYCSSHPDRSTMVSPCEIHSIEQLCISVLSRPIRLIRIFDNKNLQRDLPKVIVIGRRHGNVDSVSSYVCQGLMDFALCDHPLARFSRKLMQLVVVPMFDPDSSTVGNARSDIFGQSEMSTKLVLSNPVIYSNILRLVELLKESTKQHRVVLLEFRVNINLIGLRTVSILYNDPVRMERHLQLPRLFARFIDSFYLEKCVFFEKGNGPHLPLGDIGSDKNLDWYAIEISPFASYDRSINSYSYKELSQFDYLLIGKGIIYSLTEMLHTKKSGSVPKDVLSELEKFKSNPQDVDMLVLDQRNKISAQYNRDQQTSRRVLKSS